MQADAWATALLVAGPGDGLALAQRMGLDALFLLRRTEGLAEMGLGRFGVGDKKGMVDAHARLLQAANAGRVAS